MVDNKRKRKKKSKPDYEKDARFIFNINDKPDKKRSPSRSSGSSGSPSPKKSKKKGKKNRKDISKIEMATTVGLAIVTARGLMPALFEKRVEKDGEFSLEQDMGKWGETVGLPQTQKLTLGTVPRIDKIDVRRYSEEARMNILKQYYNKYKHLADWKFKWVKFNSNEAWQQDYDLLNRGEWLEWMRLMNSNIQMYLDYQQYRDAQLIWDMHMVRFPKDANSYPNQAM